MEITYCSRCGKECLKNSGCIRVITFGVEKIYRDLCETCLNGVIKYIDHEWEVAPDTTVLQVRK